jgi:hypothetical protein
MALSGIRITKPRQGRYATYKVAADVKIWGGALVVLEDGYAKPGYAGVGLIAAGKATETVDNVGGLAGEKSITVERSGGEVEFLYVNDTATPVAQADVGGPCFILDDQTVSGDDTDRSVAGTVCEVIPGTPGSVWIRFPS